MRYIRQIRLAPRGRLVLVMALSMFGGTGSARADRFPPDPVEALKNALAVPIRDPERNKAELTAREKTLTELIAHLKTIGDMRRALTLLEWKDEDTEAAIGEVDRKARDGLADRLVNALKRVLQRGQPADQLAALALLGEMGISEREGSNRLSVEGKIIKGRTSFTLASLASRLAAAVAGLVTTTNDSLVRQAAAKTMGKMNPEPQDVMPAFRGLLTTAGVADRRAAGEGLVNLAQGTRVIAGRPSITSAERTLVVSTGKMVIPVAAQGLADADAEVRRLCTQAIQLTAAGLPELVIDIHTETLPLRGLPPRNLNRPIREDERAAIQEYTKDVEIERQQVTPLVLALTENAAALNRVLRDPNPETRLLANHALEDLASGRWRLIRRQESIPSLPSDKSAPKEKETGGPKQEDRGDLEEEDEVLPPPLAQGTADPILKGILSDLASVIADLEDCDVRVRLAAIDVLEWLGEEAYPAAAALRKDLRDKDGFVRWAAARVLGKIGPKAGIEQTVPALTPLFKDEDFDVRVAAARALERYGPDARAAVPALIDTLYGQKDFETRQAVIATLLAIGTDSRPAIPALTAVLDDPSQRVRRPAAELLGRFGPEAQSAVPALRKLLDDPDAEVRKAASEALLQILPTP